MDKFLGTRYEHALTQLIIEDFFLNLNQENGDCGDEKGIQIFHLTIICNLSI